MRKPAYLPESRKCACGCGYPAAPGRKYVDDRHMDRASNRRYWSKNGNRYTRKATQAEMFPSKKPGKCSCGNYANCLICRNAERRRAWKAGEIPVYRMQALETLSGD